MNIYQYGLLGRRLSKYGFSCVYSNEEGECYFLQTGRYTMLIIEGKYEPFEEDPEELEMYYDFYKESLHPGYQGCDMICEHSDSSKLMKRIEKYFKNRERYMKEREHEEYYFRSKKG